MIVTYDHTSNPRKGQAMSNYARTLENRLLGYHRPANSSVEFEPDGNKIGDQLFLRYRAHFPGELQEDTDWAYAALDENGDPEVYTEEQFRQLYTGELDGGFDPNDLPDDSADDEEPEYLSEHERNWEQGRGHSFEAQ